MAHEVEQMFSVYTAPWHLGIEGGTTEDQVKVLTEYPGREEAMRLSGHDFQVVEEPQYRRIVRQVEVSADGGVEKTVEQVSYVKVEGYKYLVSDKSTENNKVLHSAKESYAVVQPDVLYDLTEAILEADGDVQWETGGTLREGAVLWTLAKVNKPFYVGSDPSPIMPYVAASTTNDGTGGVKVQNLKTRIVCMNTFGQAERETEESGREFTFRHTKNVATRIEKAKEILAGANKQANRFRELGEELIGVTFTDKAIEQFLVEFIPTPPETLISDRVKNNVDEARAKVKGLFDSKTIDPSIRNTAYGALQVAVEYNQHLRKFRNNSTYLGRTLLNVEPLTVRLLPTIRRIADENKALSVIA